MHLAQHEPLGPHGNAIRYVLQTRGAQQLYDRAPKSLWCIANQRLLARKLILHEKPDPVQLELSDLLNTSRPNIHLVDDCLKMTSLCADSHNLVSGQGMAQLAETAVTLVERVENLLQRMRELLDEIGVWTSTVTEVWKPKTINAAPILSFRGHPANHPLASFSCSDFLSYTDNYFAYIWNFHAACQIVLRESIIDLIEYRAAMQFEAVDESGQDAVRREQDTIEKLSSSIIRSFPPLMGFIDDTDQQSAPSQGKMAGRFLALFALDVILRAKSTTLEHKHIALTVTQWVYASHAIG